MLALHRATPDFTVQGLSQTFALLASVNKSIGGEMELVECDDLGATRNSLKGSALWQEEVPLLSGSIKIKEEGQGWANLKTSVRSFAERWIEFVDISD